MNICVCIKQVPASSNVKINPDTGTLVRDGDNTKINPYDLYELELALKVKEQKEYLVNKFGEEMYISLFKAKVEAGAIYNKEINDYTITTEDIQKAAFSDGKTERRNAFAAKIG